MSTWRTDYKGGFILSELSLTDLESEMTNQSLPKYDDLLKPDGPVCIAITASLVPIGGTDRFQPAGFPEVGHVIYDAPRVDGDSRDEGESMHRR